MYWNRIEKNRQQNVLTIILLLIFHYCDAILGKSTIFIILNFYNFAKIIGCFLLKDLSWLRSDHKINDHWLDRVNKEMHFKLKMNFVCGVLCNIRKRRRKIRKINKLHNINNR